MALVHIDHTGHITWVFGATSMDGTAAVTLGIQTDNNDVQQVADKANRAWRTTMHPGTWFGCALTVVHAQLHLSGNVEVADSFASLPVAGTQTGDCMPYSVAVLVQKRTAFAGRKNRGRLYVPCVAQSDVNSSTDPNALDAAHLTGWQSRADAFFAALQDSADGDALHPVILHPEPSTTVTAITSFSVQPRLATQRGRLRG